jgi:hypothetical protein
MNIFALALHDCIKFSTLGLSLSLSVARSLTIPDISGSYLCANTPGKGKTDANRHTQKSKQTQTDAPKSQNRPKRTGTHIKTGANAMYVRASTNGRPPTGFSAKAEGSWTRTNTVLQFCF